MGYSIHAGQVIVADGTPDMAERITRVLSNDPGIGVIRHADAGYNDAINNADRWDIDIPMSKDR
jgi:urocanate hydratase